MSLGIILMQVRETELKQVISPKRKNIKQK